ncbi:MAG: ATP-binding protein [Patescibacteria group bacterium]
MPEIIKVGLITIGISLIIIVASAGLIFFYRYFVQSIYRLIEKERALNKAFPGTPLQYDSSTGGFATKGKEVQKSAQSGSAQSVTVHVLENDLKKIGIPASKQSDVSRLIRNLATQQADEEVNQVRHAFKQQLDEKEQALAQTHQNFTRINKKLEAVSASYAKLGKEKKQTEDVVRSLADGLIVVDDQGRTVLMNPAAEKLLGTELKNVLGKRISDQQSEDRVISIAQNREGQKDKQIVLSGVSEETKEVLKASSAVIENEAGQTMGMVSVLSDVTKHKELKAMQSQFVAKVSHELQPPLRRILESLKLLSDNPTDDNNAKQKEVLELVSRNIGRLTTLTNNLHYLSQIEAGNIKLDISEFQLEELIEQIKKSFKTWADSKNVTIETSFPPEIVKLHADQNKIGQVLTNLIENSMKFVERSGKIEIEVKPADNVVEVGIKDDGPGISEKDRKSIFEKFKQLRDSEGVGLGLTIAKEFVKLHGGHISVKSEEGKGSLFTISIPM